MSSEQTNPSQRSERVFKTLLDEGGETTTWLASSYSEQDIRDEWDYLFENPKVKLREIWIRQRPTSPEELADEDQLYDLFGDWEMNGIDTSAVPEFVPQGTPGAHRYWTVD